MHVTDNGHHRQSPVSGYATAVDLEGSRLHPRLLDHQQAVAGRTATDLHRDLFHQGRDREHTDHACRQQVRRDVGARGLDAGGHDAFEDLEVRLHGDVGEDGSQRQRTLPGAAAARTAPDDDAEPRLEKVAEPPRDAEGKMRRHVDLRRARWAWLLRRRRRAARRTCRSTVT